MSFPFAVVAVAGQVIGIALLSQVAFSNNCFNKTEKVSF